MALNDKLINYGNLAEFHSQILNDTGSTTGVTWSANKISTELASKQDTLVAGEGIEISGNTISAIAIEDVQALPDAIANKNKLVRLASDKKVYVSEYVEGTPGLGFSALQMTSYGVYKRYPDGDNTNDDDGYENYQICWNLITDSGGMIINDVTDWSDLSGNYAFTISENVDIGTDIYDWALTGEIYTVTEYSSDVNYTPSTYFWRKLDIKLQSIIYSELKSLRDNSQLVPGQQYRITDYITTTTHANTQSAGHQFDIIVTADDVNKLNENARAINHTYTNDDYFYKNYLESWELKYCLDNDTDRFSWADTTNGKGVIYYMKDNFGNEAPYDFKNIMFKWTDTTYQQSPIKLNVYYYTFSNVSGTNDENVSDKTIYDINDFNNGQCINNIIKS